MESPKPLTQLLESSFSRPFHSFSFLLLFFRAFAPFLPFPDVDRWRSKTRSKRVGRNEGKNTYTHKTLTRERTYNIRIRGEKRKKEEGEKKMEEGVRCRRETRGDYDVDVDDDDQR